MGGEEAPSPKRRRVEDASEATGCELRIGKQFFGDSPSFRLLEATPEVLAAVESGSRVYFSVSEDSEAVLCTATSTRKLQKVETSNTMLLVPPKSAVEGGDGLPVFEAVGSAQFVLESEVASPDLTRLKEALERQPYGKEGSVPGQRPTMEELVGTVPASEEEIKKALAALHAMEVDGRWCAVDQQCMEETFSSILLEIIAQDLPLAAVQVSECMRYLGEDADERLVQHALRVHSKDADAGAKEGSFAVDLVKASIFQANRLLRETPRIPETDFLEALAARVPGDPLEDTAIRDSVLRGLALREASKDAAPILHYFPEAVLSVAPEARFQELFHRQARWTREELEPYIEPITGPGVTMDGLLLQHARTVVEGSGEASGPSSGSTQTFYSAR